MISLKKTVDDLDAQNRAFRAALDAFVTAVGSVERHAVPLVSEVTQSHRVRLKSLQRAVLSDASAENLSQTCSALDEEIKGYNERVVNSIQQNERDIKELLAALGELAATITSRNDVYSGRLSGFTTRLEAISHVDDSREVRRLISEQIPSLRKCLQSLWEETQSTVNSMQQQLQTFEKRLEQAERLAATDQLTGLLNRRDGENRLEMKIAAGVPFCLIFVDLDRFKAINDRYSHHVGDMVLREFARRLERCVRPRDVVCRWGGDEFVILMECGLTDAIRRARQIGEHLRGRYSVTAGEKQVSVDVSASIGVSEYVQGEKSEELFRRAEAAVYRQKK